MDVNTRITFTPRAKAVLGNAAASIRTQWLRFGASCAIGDQVLFAGCSSTFLVLCRMWTLAEGAETLEIALDLLQEEPDLQPVR